MRESVPRMTRVSRLSPNKSGALSAAPSYRGLLPASAAASNVGRGNKKTNTAPERVLRGAVHRLGGRYRTNTIVVFGRPDLVFTTYRVAVFCDGDFWHGRNWEARKQKLARGTNAQYWLAKIERNVQRDRYVNQQLRAAGWMVLRFWESDVKRDPIKAAKRILRAVANRRVP